MRLEGLIDRTHRSLKPKELQREGSLRRLFNAKRSSR